MHKRYLSPLGNNSTGDAHGEFEGLILPSSSNLFISPLNASLFTADNLYGWHLIGGLVPVLFGG